jgi:hypothetical protein
MKTLLCWILLVISSGARMAEISFLWLHWIDASDDDRLFDLLKRKYGTGTNSQS